MSSFKENQQWPTFKPQVKSYKCIPNCQTPPTTPKQFLSISLWQDMDKESLWQDSDTSYSAMSPSYQVIPPPYSLGEMWVEDFQLFPRRGVKNILMVPSKTSRLEFNGSNLFRYLNCSSPFVFDIKQSKVEMNDNCVGTRGILFPVSCKYSWARVEFVFRLMEKQVDHGIQCKHIPLTLPNENKKVFFVRWVSIPLHLYDKMPYRIDSGQLESSHLMNAPAVLSSAFWQEPNMTDFWLPKLYRLDFLPNGYEQQVLPCRWLSCHMQSDARVSEENVFEFIETNVKNMKSIRYVVLDFLSLGLFIIIFSDLDSCEQMFNDFRSTLLVQIVHYLDKNIFKNFIKLADNLEKVVVLSPHGWQYEHVGQDIFVENDTLLISCSNFNHLEYIKGFLVSSFSIRRIIQSKLTKKSPALAIVFSDIRMAEHVKFSIHPSTVLDQSIIMEILESKNIDELFEQETTDADPATPDQQPLDYSTWLQVDEKKYNRSSPLAKRSFDEGVLERLPNVFASFQLDETADESEEETRRDWIQEKGELWDHNEVHEQRDAWEDKREVLPSETESKDWPAPPWTSPLKSWAKDSRAFDPFGSPLLFQDSLKKPNPVNNNDLLVPKKFRIQSGPTPSSNDIDLNRIEQGNDTRTTCMIRNIPNKYTQQMLLEFINETHRGTYDFMYLRMDFKNRCNVGYAFINFIEPSAIISFAKRVCGKKWSKFNSDKICSLSYANIQGKLALIEKFKNSSVMEEEPSYRPKIFYSCGEEKGQEEPFPTPDSKTNRTFRKTAQNNPAMQRSANLFAKRSSPSMDMMMDATTRIPWQRPWGKKI